MQDKEDIIVYGTANGHKRPVDGFERGAAPDVAVDSLEAVSECLQKARPSRRR